MVGGAKELSNNMKKNKKQKPACLYVDGMLQYREKNQSHRREGENCWSLRKKRGIRPNM